MTGQGGMAIDPLVADIYEAALLPENWQGVLDGLARIADAEGSLLFAACPGAPRWLASKAIHAAVTEWVESKWYLDNPRGRRLVPLTEPRFLTDLHALTIEEIEASDYYTDLLRPRGLGWCVGTSIRSPSGDTLVFSIEKAHKKGPVPQSVADELDKLRPHLARAAVLSGRLGLDRAKSTVATLEMIGLPAAALSNTGRVISANLGFLTSSPRIRVGANDAVKFEIESAQRLLMEAVSNSSNWETGTGKSIPVAGTTDDPPLVAHIIPLRGGALDLFTGAMSIMFLTPVVPKSSPAPELLQALFDLTPAEARLASQLTQGKSIEQIGRSSDLSPNTLRSQLKSVFSKTGVRRQTELVSLLGIRTV